MSIKIHDLKVSLDADLETFIKKRFPEIARFRVLKKSIDARHSPPHFIYSIEGFLAEEKEPIFEPVNQVKFHASVQPIVIGAGPAGLFAALRLVESGVPCTILEQGSETVRRLVGISQYWRYGKLDERNNVCFGEGGAGLFSDGKLMTRIRSPHIPFVLQKLVECGAPAEIEYEANPHVGSNRLRQVIINLRKYLISHGCQIAFQTKVIDIGINHQQVTSVELEDGRKLPTQCVILAPGHSAMELHHRLYQKGMLLKPQSFAVGLRIEHPQSLINQIQFGRYSEDSRLGAATYTLTDYNQALESGVYSFCMCPGGYVISSGTEQTGVVSNGMSNYSRSSKFANSALVVSLNYEEHFGSELFAGLQFREDLERKAFTMVKSSGGSRELPGQRVVDFLAKSSGPLLPTSSPSGVRRARLDQLFSEKIRQRLVESLMKFNQRMKGFTSDVAQLYGVESRTSCPLRISRDERTYESVNIRGLYPAGEGAGYAGGITSAAVDGVRVAEAVINRFDG